MKIAILFTLIGLSLCQDELLPNPSCATAEECIEKIKAMTKEDLLKLGNAYFCDAFRNETRLDILVRKLKCLPCDPEKIPVLAIELFISLEKANLLRSLCSQTYLANAVIEEAAGLLVGAGHK